jgi:flagellar biosynthesis chaperone FliJ
VSTYRFRLATLLKLRRAAEEQCRADLAAANRALREAILFRDTETARLATLKPVDGLTFMPDLVREEMQTAFVAVSVLQARDVVNEALATAARAQVAWTKASRAVEALLRLDATRRAEHHAEELRIEAIDADDISTATFQRRELATGSS